MVWAFLAGAALGSNELLYEAMNPHVELALRLDGAGEVLLEQEAEHHPKVTQEVFGGMPRSRIASETGMHSPWVSRLLSEWGDEVIVAKCARIPHSTAKDGADRKTFSRF